MDHQKPKLFAPTKIGKLTAPNATMASSVWLALSSTEKKNAPTPAIVHHYKEMAQGNVGVILFEHSCVDIEFGQATESQVAITEENVQEHAAMVKEVKAVGSDSLFMIQLAHGGVHSTTAKRIVPTASLKSGYPGDDKWTPVEPSDEEIPEVIVKPFVEAAVRAAEAGYDGAEVHGAHGYCISTFLSKKYNQRPVTSRYTGSTPEGRTRLLIEILQGIRSAVMERFPTFALGFKISTADFPRETEDGTGNTYNDTADHIRLVTENVPIDFVELSGGSAFSKPTEAPIRPGRFSGEAEAWYLHAAQSVRTTLKNASAKNPDLQIPAIALVGGMRSTARCSEVVESGDVDFVSFGRPVLCQPDLPRAMEADPEAVASCIGCMACIKSAVGGKKMGALTCPIRHKTGLNAAMQDLF